MDVQKRIEKIKSEIAMCLEREVSGEESPLISFIKYGILQSTLEFLQSSISEVSN